MRIGFTGTRLPLTPYQLGALSRCLVDLRDRGATALHHGDCVGADTVAHHLALQLGLDVVIHPPKNPRLRAYNEARDIREPKGYWARNRDIVAECKEVVACPKAGTTIDDWKGSGTWFTVKFAQEHEVPVHLIQPDGRVG